MTMMPSAMLIVWLMPVMIDGTACGSCTLNSSLAAGRAEHVAGLDGLRRVRWRIAEGGEAHDRRQGVDHRGHRGRHRADAEEQHGRHEVRRRRHGLHRVEHRPEERVERCG